MSIDIGNNVNLTCGFKLPTLYVENVTIKNNMLEVKLSIYVSLAPQHDIGDLHDEVSGLFYYLTPVFDGPVSESGPHRLVSTSAAEESSFPWEEFFETGPSEMTDWYSYSSEFIGIADYSDVEYASGTSNINDLINSRIGIFDYVYRSLSINSQFDFFEPYTEEDKLLYNGVMTGGHKNFIKLSIDDFEVAEEILKTDKTGASSTEYKVLKLITEFEIGNLFTVLEDMGSYAYDLDPLYAYAAGADIYADPWPPPNVDEMYTKMGFKDLALFTFTLPESLSTNFVDLFDPGGILSEDPSRLVKFYDSLTSQVSYQKVFIDGLPARDPNVIFTYQEEDENVIYNGDVMQTIDGSYHAFRGTLDRETLVEQIWALSSGFDASVEIDAAFQTVIDSFNSIMISYGDS